MTAVDVAAKVRATALAAVEQQCFGEDFGVDTATVLAQSGGGVVVLYALIVSCRSPLLGQGPLVTVTQMQSPHPGAEQIEQAVTQALSGLRELTTKLLADVPAAPLQPR